MRRIGVTSARVAVLGLGMLLGACSAYERSTSWLNRGSAQATDGIANAGASIGAPWGRTRPTMPEDSVTIARLSGAPVQITPLTPESGDVWPVPEAPRSTLANPDAAMRGIPTYRPGDFDRPSAPAGRSQWQPTDPPNPAPLPPGLRSGASAPGPRLDPQPIPGPQAVAPPLAPLNNAPRRADGRVILTPQGSAVTSGGTDRVQGYITPGGGSGTAVTDGNTTTLFDPTGRIQTVPAQR
jgi:hypothetical protein